MPFLSEWDTEIKKIFRKKIDVCLSSMKKKKKNILLIYIFFVHFQRKSVIGPGEQDLSFVDVRIGGHMFYWLYETMANVSTYTEPSHGHLVAGWSRSLLYRLWQFVNVCS